MAPTTPKGIVEPAITLPDVEAFEALQAGVASAAQQRRVGEWLITEACRLLSSPTEEVKAAGSTDLAHDLAFAEGRRYVGILMRRMLLPDTRDRAAALTKALHPDATRTSVSRRPTLSQRRGSRGEPT